MNEELGRSYHIDGNEAVKVITYSETLSTEQLSTLKTRSEPWSRIYTDTAISIQTTGLIPNNQIAIRSRWRPYKLRYVIGKLDAFQTASFLWKDCCNLWRNGFVHGDINQKNLRFDCSRPYLIDFEPFLTRSIKGKITGVPTKTYFHPIDRKHGVTATYRTDLLGLLCLFFAFMRTDTHPSLFVQRSEEIMSMFGWTRNPPELDQMNHVYEEIEAQSGTI